MGGVMPDRERDAAIKRLRRAAWEYLERMSARTEMKLDNAWRAFPECERDEARPNAGRILELCDQYDRQKEEAERIKARMATTTR